MDVSLTERLRRLSQLTQSEFAEVLGVNQSAVSHYESGRRSPRVDVIVAAAESTGRSVGLLPAELAQPRDPAELLGRLLRLAVAQHFFLDPERVRSVATKNLNRQQSTPGADFYVEQWRELLTPGNEVELLVILSVPDRERSGLLSSSPFAGVVDQDERDQLIARASETLTQNSGIQS